MKNLKYDMIGASMAGSSDHPEKAMADLGITYKLSTPQSLYDSWWFWGCENVPAELPSYIDTLKADPQKGVGHGLSQKEVDELTVAIAAPVKSYEPLDFWDIGLTPSPNPIPFSFPIQGCHIAPPVAAGSVDTQEFRNYLAWRCRDSSEEFAQRIIAHVDAWGAQQREVALAEQMALFKKCCENDQAEFSRKWTEQKERAEKAEADLKQVNEWREAALASNQQMQELMVAKLASAEARVKELEAAISKDDLVLRASVPKRWKGGADPVFCVQSYITELEEIAHNHGINPLYLGE